MHAFISIHNDYCNALLLGLLTPSAAPELGCSRVDEDQKAGSHYTDLKITASAPCVFQD